MNIISEFSLTVPNETYHGLILTLQDALLLLEGIRRNLLPKVRRRLNDFERKHITAGSVFAWNENELSMKRWTDGKNWLALKVKGPFLIYQELDQARNVKPNGLVKQLFSLTTKQNEKLHLIAYYNPLDRAKDVLAGKIPSQDPLLVKLSLDPAVYLNDFLHYNTADAAPLPQQYQPQPPHHAFSVPYPLPYEHRAGSHSAPLLPHQPQPLQTHYFQPVHPTYYCHPLMVPYQYHQQYHPQQQVYVQPMASHMYPHADAAYPTAPPTAAQVAQGQALGPPFHAGAAAAAAAATQQYHHTVYAQLRPSTAALLARASISSQHQPLLYLAPSPQNQGLYNASPANGLYKPVDLPAFTYAAKSLALPQSLPLPNLPKLTPQTLPLLLDSGLKFDTILTVPVQPLRLPLQLQLLCVQYHPDVRNKLNELDKAFSV